MLYLVKRRERLGVGVGGMGWQRRRGKGCMQGMQGRGHHRPSPSQEPCMHTRPSEQESESERARAARARAARPPRSWACCSGWADSGPTPRATPQLSISQYGFGPPPFFGPPAPPPQPSAADQPALYICPWDPRCIPDSGALLACALPTTPPPPRHTTRRDGRRRCPYSVSPRTTRPRLQPPPPPPPPPDLRMSMSSCLETSAFVPVPHWDFIYHLAFSQSDSAFPFQGQYRGPNQVRIQGKNLVL